MEEMMAHADDVRTEMVTKARNLDAVLPPASMSEAEAWSRPGIYAHGDAQNRYALAAIAAAEPTAAGLSPWWGHCDVGGDPYRMIRSIIRWAVRKSIVATVAAMALVDEALLREPGSDGSVWIGKGRDLPADWREIQRIAGHEWTVEEFWTPAMAGTTREDLDWYLVPVREEADGE